VTIDANTIISSNEYSDLYSPYGRYISDSPKGYENQIIINNSTLHDIPQKIFTYFKVLSFKAENSSLPKINSTVFGISNSHNLKQLKNIYLSHNEITILEHMVFGGAAELQTIDLSYNTMSIIKETAFYGLKKLTWLDLSYNTIVNLEQGQLVELVMLDTILLSHNLIEKIPSKFFEHNGALKTVYLNNNKLKSLDSATTLKLDLINLANNQLEMFDFVNIEATEQILSNNFLETIVIGEYVKTLELSNNKIANILVNDSNQLTNLSLRSSNICDISFWRKQQTSKL
jgi:Leucine-rich repeat (LRR) protein